MRDIYNENAQSDFAKTYLTALQAIIRFDEELAGARLNKVRNIMRQTVKSDGLPVAITAENAIFIELRNNRIMERGILYGDYKSTSKAPWIKDPVLLGMIKSHVGLMGNPEDKEVLQDFLAKTEAFFGQPAKPATPAQRILAVV